VRGSAGARSLVAARAFAANATICAVSWGPSSPVPTRWTLQIGDEQHAEPLPGALHYANHSCDPNIVFDLERDVVRAIRNIPARAELSFFYPSTEWSMAEPFRCDCTAPGCIGVVAGASGLDPSTLARHELSPVIRDPALRRAGTRGRRAATRAGRPPGGRRAARPA
jgi:hypothetical protein